LLALESMPRPSVASIEMAVLMILLLPNSSTGASSRPAPEDIYPLLSVN